MKSPIQSLVELVKDRDLRQKANKDTMSGAAPLKVPATLSAVENAEEEHFIPVGKKITIFALIAVLTVLSEPIIA